MGTVLPNLDTLHVEQHEIDTVQLNQYHVKIINNPEHLVIEKFNNPISTLRDCLLRNDMVIISSNKHLGKNGIFLSWNGTNAYFLLDGQRIAIPLRVSILLLEQPF
ncbi:hypothetical protein CYY_009869 [Polysphondylium violaceum]|uniref:Uncharacterized protein n=1 Tax=Polysphondylium violaceum TaxID=133409 RepID=A0A8J4PL21_9MYCE|nr:hypothetical protein CYY_009869 [Polysphondylium violaceum]